MLDFHCYWSGRNVSIWFQIVVPPRMMTCCNLFRNFVWDLIPYLNKLWIYDSSCWPFEAYDMAFKTAASPLQRLAAQINISIIFVCLRIAGILHCFDKQLNFVRRQRIPKYSWIPDFPFVMILKLNHTINYFHTFLSCALLVTVSLVCCYCFL